MATKHASLPRKQRSLGFSLIEARSSSPWPPSSPPRAVPSLVDFIDGRRSTPSPPRSPPTCSSCAPKRSPATSRCASASTRRPAGTCWVVHTGAAAQCRCDDAPPAVCTGGAREIKTVILGAVDRVSVQANVASIAFDPMHGTSTPTGTLRLIDRRGRAVHHVVNVMGRVRSCTPPASRLARLLNLDLETDMHKALRSRSLRPAVARAAASPWSRC
jgi:type IV fimbrial biogenesis protein FimT